MNEDAKNTASTKFPYDLNVLVGEDAEERFSGATVNWVTQTSFQPPLVTVGVKRDSLIHDINKTSGTMALEFTCKKTNKA